MLATTLGAEFLGGIAAGFLAGYATKLMNDFIKLPENFEGLKPVLILPLLSTLVVGLVMISLAASVRLLVPHGGVFVLLIPNAVQHLGFYIVAIVAGTLVTAAALFVVKRPVVAE
jgi:fructose-specific phosphotransferase system IIC component